MNIARIEQAVERGRLDYYLEADNRLLIVKPKMPIWCVALRSWQSSWWHWTSGQKAQEAMLYGAISVSDIWRFPVAEPATNMSLRI
ncbi:MAG: hypothetical protein R2873_22040 [Caldilineaceae bacterium]